MKKAACILTFCLLSLGCSFRTPQETLKVVTYAEFEHFVRETGFVTDAEKFGWSIVSQDVYNFTTVEGANWKKPDGINSPESKDLPVTQVSYNDALAYCQWSQTKLPTYAEYWELITNDKRKIVNNYNAPISEVEDVNILGNVWEITSSTRGAEVRLAGGSLFCSPSTCNGTVESRELYVDQQTGNIHIGFAVLPEN